MKNLSVKQVVILMGHAKDNLINMPQKGRLFGDLRDLTEGERLAVAYFGATLSVLGGMGVDTSDIKITFDDADGEPVE